MIVLWAALASGTAALPYAPASATSAPVSARSNHPYLSKLGSCISQVPSGDTLHPEHHLRADYQWACDKGRGALAPRLSTSNDFLLASTTARRPLGPARAACGAPYPHLGGGKGIGWLLWPFRRLAQAWHRLSLAGPPLSASRASGCNLSGPLRASPSGVMTFSNPGKIAVETRSIFQVNIPTPQHIFSDRALALSSSTYSVDVDRSISRLPTGFSSSGIHSASLLDLVHYCLNQFHHLSSRTYSWSPSMSFYFFDAVDLFLSAAGALKSPGPILTAPAWHAGYFASWFTSTSTKITTPRTANSRPHRDSTSTTADFGASTYTRSSPPMLRFVFVIQMLY